MTDTSHLFALQHRLSNERSRFLEAATDSERELRAVWVSQIEREIYFEYQRLGVQPDEPPADLTDDELLAELSA